MIDKLGRRAFLGAAAAPFLVRDLNPFGGGAPRAAGAATTAPALAPAQAFRVGHNLTTYVSGNKGVDGFWTGIEEVASQGVRGTEVDNTPSHLTETYGTKPAEVKARLAKNHIELIALYHTLPVGDASQYDQNMASALAAGTFLAAVGGSILNLAGGKRPQPDPTEEFRAFARLVNDLGKRLKEEHGVRLGYHPHMGLMIQTREDIARAMDLTKPEYFNLCPDTGHLLAAGADPLEIFKTYRSRIIYMHYKDWDPTLVTPRTAETGRKGGFVELGKGQVDFTALTAFLLETRYDGWVMIELDRAPGLPLDAVKTNLRYMTDTLGLTVG